MSYYKNGENGFDCPECNDFHKMPLNGYLINPKIAKLCDKLAVAVSRHQIDDCIKKIKENCDHIRNEAQLISEELIGTIQTNKLELLEQIDAYRRFAILSPLRK